MTLPMKSTKQFSAFPFPSNFNTSKATKTKTLQSKTYQQKHNSTLLAMSVQGKTWKTSPSTSNPILLYRKLPPLPYQTANNGLPTRCIYARVCVSTSIPSIPNQQVQMATRNNRSNWMVNYQTNAQMTNTIGKYQNFKNHSRMDSHQSITWKPTYQRNRLVMPFLPAVSRNTWPPNLMWSPQLATNLTQAPNQTTLDLHQVPPRPTPLPNVVDQTNHTQWPHNPHPCNVLTPVPLNLWQSIQHRMEATLLWTHIQTMDTPPHPVPSNNWCCQNPLQDTTRNLDNNPGIMGIPKQWQCPCNS